MFQSVEPDEMAFALTLFVSAASGQISAGQKPLTVKSRQQGEELFLKLALPGDARLDQERAAALLKTVLFQAFLIVWEHYRADDAQGSLGARVLGFYYVMTQSRGAALQRWATPNEQSDEKIWIDAAVVNALADIPLHPDGHLDEAVFLSRIDVPPLKVPDSLPQTDNWPSGDNVMASLVRQHDWAATELGPIESWPESLRAIVQLALACRFPMIVLWGPDLTQIYNDGYQSLMGTKHPRGLGQPTQDCWPEVWPINQPIYQKVLRGETLTVEDGLYRIHRHGRLEDAYFTLCYSPLRAEDNAIHGILVTVFETTERVVADGDARKTP